MNAEISIHFLIIRIRHQCWLYASLHLESDILWLHGHMLSLGAFFSLFCSHLSSLPNSWWSRAPPDTVGLVWLIKFTSFSSGTIVVLIFSAWVILYIYFPRILRICLSLHFLAFALMWDRIPYIQFYKNISKLKILEQLRTIPASEFKAYNNSLLVTFPGALDV